MIAEDLEFQISQYVDGTLSPSERMLVDDLLKSDPQARQLLSDYRQIDAQLIQLRGKPAVRWDRLAEHISSVIKKSDQSEPVIAGRIGWAAWSGRLRIAAGVLIVATVGLIVRHAIHPSTVVPTNQPVSQLEVTGPGPDVATGTPSEDISVGPSPRFAADEAGTHNVDAVIVPSPSKVVITAGINAKPKGKSQPH